MRLWDRRSLNPVASVKVVHHNILTATSVLHELGHQIAHITAWNDELGEALRKGLPGGLGKVWSSWATEIAADAIAFVRRDDQDEVLVVVDRSGSPRDISLPRAFEDARVLFGDAAVAAVGDATVVSLGRMSAAIIGR